MTSFESTEKDDHLAKQGLTCIDQIRALVVCYRVFWVNHRLLSVLDRGIDKTSPHHLVTYQGVHFASSRIMIPFLPGLAASSIHKRVSADHSLTAPSFLRCYGSVRKSALKQRGILTTLK